MTAPPIHVMVVGDHLIVRIAVAALVAAAADMVVCAETATADAERRAEAVNPDVVLVDLHLTDGSCIVASRRIRNRRPGTQVLILTAASDSDALLASILSGAAGYLPKQLRGTDVVATIRAVARGSRLLDPAEVEALVRGRDDRSLLMLMARGHTDQDLQRELGIDASPLLPRLAQLLDDSDPTRTGVRPVRRQDNETNGHALA